MWGTHCRKENTQDYFSKINKHISLLNIGGLETANGHPPVQIEKIKTFQRFKTNKMSKFFKLHFSPKLHFYHKVIQLLITQN